MHQNDNFHENLCRGDMMEKSELLETLQEFQEKEGGIDSLTFFESVEAVIRGLQEGIQLHDMKELVDFCADQVSFWEGEYLFSSIYEPNMAAKEELERWEDLWVSWSSLLIEKVPNVEDSLHKIKQHKCIGNLIERRVKYNKGNFFRQPMGTFLGHTSFAFKRVGLRKIAEYLYTLSMFPPGTIGRVS
jgi:hypothetical protein